MYNIDSSIPLTLSCDEVLQLSTVQIEGKSMFEKFTKGIQLNADILFSKYWNGIDGSMTNSAGYTLSFVMLEILPHCYDIKHLQSIGGSLGFKILGVGDFTIYAFNQRVVVLTGLPFDSEIEQEICDIQIVPDVFIAFLRGQLLGLSESILENDDEDEDRQISNAELQLYGMPSGGADGTSEHCGTDAIACGADKASHITCSADGVACGADAGFQGGCAADADVCGANAETGAVCASDAALCGANATAGTTCSANVEGCAANASAGEACVGNAIACAAAASAGVACAGDAGACGVDVAAADACAGKATACGADVAAGVCSANADACGVKALDLCPAHAGVCGIDVEDGDIVSACLINVIPGLPSC